ncbi:MAG TPA: hypothetical protein VFV34_07825, partial [Blastocatellia bacterium]|nr:hypothetical protein [Blastocatellia bacterium]
MRIGRVKLGPGAVILILLVMAGLVYVGLKQLGILEKITEGGRGTGSVVPDPVKRPDEIRASLPTTSVTAPQPTRDNPEVVIGIWTWQTVSGIIDAVGGPG